MNFRFTFLLLLTTICIQGYAIQRFSELEFCESNSRVKYLVLSDSQYEVFENWKVRKTIPLKKGDVVTFLDIRKGTIDGIKAKWGLVKTITRNNHKSLAQGLIVSLEDIIRIENRFYRVATTQYFTPTGSMVSEEILRQGDTIYCETIINQKSVPFNKIKGGYRIDFEKIFVPTQILEPIVADLNVKKLNRIVYKSNEELRGFLHKIIAFFFFLVFIPFIIFFTLKHKKLTFRLINLKLHAYEKEIYKCEFVNGKLITQDRYQDIVTTYRAGYAYSDGNTIHHAPPSVSIKAFDRTELYVLDEFNKIHIIYEKKEVPVFTGEIVLIYTISGQNTEDFRLGYVFKSLKHYYVANNRVLKRLITKNTNLGFNYFSPLYFVFIYLGSFLLGKFILLNSDPIIKLSEYTFPFSYVIACLIILSALIIYLIILLFRYRASVKQELTLFYSTIHNDLITLIQNLKTNKNAE